MPPHRLGSLTKRLLPHLPSRLRTLVTNPRYPFNPERKRGRSGTLLEDMGVDLLFCPFTAPTYSEPGIATVCTIHDLQYKSYPEFFAPEDVAQRERTFFEASHRATALAAVSHYSRDSAIAHGNLDPARITTIHHRIAQRIASYPVDNQGIMSRLGLVAQRYLIYPANFWKHKNHEMLLTALGMAFHQGLPADIKLVCTGAPGARQEWLIRAARAMNLESRVSFPGFLPSDELAVVMTNCAGMVFPSLYEGFGLPVIEAMAAGVPVACSNATSLPEVAADAAITFDPRVPTQIAKAIVRLVKDEPTRQSLIVAGTKRAAEFADSERMAREYWELFVDAIRMPAKIAQLSGIYADGWSSGSLVLHLPASDEPRTLHLELVAPPWLPADKVGIETIQSGTLHASVFHLARGEERKLSLPLSPSVTRLTLQVSPTFIPSEHSMGEDDRELSVMVSKATIAGGTEIVETLYPETPTPVSTEYQDDPQAVPTTNGAAS